MMQGKTEVFVVQLLDQRTKEWYMATAYDGFSRVHASLDDAVREAKGFDGVTKSRTRIVRLLGEVVGEI